MEQPSADNGKEEIPRELLELGLEKKIYDFAEGMEKTEQALHAWERQHEGEKSIVLVAGATATGKDTFVESLSSTEPKTLIVNLDRYYLGAERMQQERGFVNFSVPEALDEKRIHDDLQKILAANIGDEVELPIYNMKTSRMEGDETVVVEPRILIHGVYALRTIDHPTPFRVYIKSDPEVMLARKLRRDVNERGVPADVVQERFTKNVLPALETYVGPQEQQASIVIENNERDLAEYQ